MTTTLTALIAARDALERAKQIYHGLTFHHPHLYPVDAAAKADAALAALRDAIQQEEAGDTESAMAFVRRVAKQKPEKPDYWNSCSQCGNNISDAKDIVAAASAPPAVDAKEGNEGS